MNNIEIIYIVVLFLVFGLGPYIWHYIRYKDYKIKGNVLFTINNVFFRHGEEGYSLYITDQAFELQSKCASPPKSWTINQIQKIIFSASIDGGYKMQLILKEGKKAQFIFEGRAKTLEKEFDFNQCQVVLRQLHIPFEIANNIEENRAYKGNLFLLLFWAFFIGVGMLILFSLLK